MGACSGKAATAAQSPTHLQSLQKKSSGEAKISKRTWSGSTTTPPASESTGDFHQTYVLGKKLGAGAFAQVRIALPRGSENEATATKAVKILDLRRPKDVDKETSTAESTDLQLDPQKEKEAVHEIKMWKQAQEGSQTCVAMFEFYYDEACIYMVMEKCDSSFYDHLESSEDLTERALAALFQQMLTAVSHIHRNKVCHRDIKPDNFLVNKRSIVKLGDFGLAVECPDDQLLKGIAGTAPFMAPEMLKHQGYNGKADVWAVGVLIYVLMYGQFPYFSQEKSSRGMKMAIKEGRLPPSYRPWKTLPEGAPRPSAVMEKMLRSMLARSTDSRLDADHALEDPYWDVLQHSKDEDLCSASFRPAVKSAVRAGAFIIMKDINKEKSKNHTDAWLSQRSHRSFCSSSTGTSIASWFGSRARAGGGAERQATDGGTRRSSSCVSQSSTTSSSISTHAQKVQKLHWPGMEVAF
mmetsp:Transcript_54621/g.130336  ORF Transcript_54621/g.130336 Transcript_54621/m.130336 type:complete len:466 (+) Transcript_54621:66-1463(+)